MKIVILGAGITGLGAAVELVGNGHEVTLLEKNDRVGGLAATLNWKNHVMDYGAFVCYPQLKAQLPQPVQAALDMRDVYGGTARLYLEEAFVDWPISPSALLRRLGAAASAAALKDFMLAQLAFRSGNNLKNAQDFLIKKIGKRLVRYSGIEQEIVKLTGKPGKDLSPWFVTDHLLRFSQISPLNYLRDKFKFRRPQKKNPPQSPATPVYPGYPLGGIGRISEEIEKYLTVNNVAIKKEVNITKICTNDNGVSGVEFTCNRHRYKIEADFIISTIPLTLVPALLDKTEITADLTDQLQFRHMLLLFLVVGKPYLSQQQLTYAFDERIPFKRLVEFKHYDHRGFPPDHTGIALEICYSHPEEIRDSEGLYTRIVENLEQMGILEKRDIIHHCFRHSPHAYPVETLGYERVRETILEGITFDNMISVGRQGIFRYSQMPFGYKMGREAANLVNRRILDKKRHLQLCNEFSYARSISGE
jgi:protoporphyrinogen oxidase